MAYSMTGFGRAEKVFDTRKYTIEMKSVNNRYCDINIRMPRLFNFADNDIRKLITSGLIRGKIDVFIYYTDIGEDCEVITVNTGLAKAYAQAAATIASATSKEDNVTVRDLCSFPDVLKVEQGAVEEDVILNELTETLKEAIDGMLAMRAREGASLVSDLLTKIDKLDEIRGKIEEREPMVIGNFRAKLSSRIDEILTSDKREFYDESRLAAEVAIFADKCAVDEEVTRLTSHFKQARKILGTEKGAIGKQMDFLVQEINREINTCGSKANDIEITGNVLAMKNIVEEIREQIQNLV
ncbi:MAG: YicC family protein [Saccharofermentans sp.]|nr:YicC family protein [Saccharofermentans sp.]